MVTFPPNVEAALRNDMFMRHEPDCVERALKRLHVAPSGLFLEFFQNFMGGYQSGRTGHLLLDLCEGTPNVEGYTVLVRERFAIPYRYLVITEYDANSVLMYDCRSDGVLDIDFEGGDDLLKSGMSPCRWDSFRSFLEEFF